MQRLTHRCIKFRVQTLAICINDFDPEDLRKLPMHMIPGDAPFRYNREKSNEAFPENRQESAEARNKRLSNAADSKGRKVMQPNTIRPVISTKKETNSEG